MKRVMSQVSASGDTIIPKEVLNQLGIRPGDSVDFKWENGQLVLKKISSEEANFLTGLQGQLTEWANTDDDELI